jgi:endoglucanase
VKKLVILFTLVAFLIPAAVAQSAAFVPVDPFVQVAQMQRGINIHAHGPSSKDFSQERFKPGYFKMIHDAGFSTVRVTLSGFDGMDAMGRLRPGWLRETDWIIDNALAAGLTVILDEHDYELCGKDAVQCRTKLIPLWEQLAARYRDAPNSVLFEILNEPNSAMTREGWNALAHDALAVIRKTNPERNIVIGPSFWNSIGELKTLELPENDRHIIVTVHYYTPMEFTHQGAKWVESTYHLSGVKWGSDAEKQKLLDDFTGVEEWSKAQQRPIFLGEFGAYDKGEMQYRTLYTETVARTAEKMHWAWAYWQFDGDFIAYDVEHEKWVEPIRKALLP